MPTVSCLELCDNINNEVIMTKASKNKFNALLPCKVDHCKKVDCYIIFLTYICMPFGRKIEKC